VSGKRFKVLVCRGPTCGRVHHSSGLRDALDGALAEAGLAEAVEVDWQSCFGRCSQGPNALVRETPATDAGVRYALAALPAERRGRSALYSRLTEVDIVAIVREHLVGGRVVRRLLSGKPSSGARPTESNDTRERRLPQVLATVRGASEGDER